MDKLLSTIKSPRDLKDLTPQQLEQLTGEMREAMCRLLGKRSALRFQPRRDRVDVGAAHHLRFQPRSPDLGHRSPDLPAQDGHRPLRGVPHDPHQGRADGLSQSGGKPLRPLHDRTCRMQHLQRAGAQVRRRPDRPGREAKCRGRDRRRRAAQRSRLRGRSTTPAGSRST